MLPAPLTAMVARLVTAVRFLRLRPFDTHTPQGRSDERHRRVALTALTSAVAKVVSLATSLISVPLTLHYLGAERYGIWMTISSFAGLLAFADLGIGLGLMNAISGAHGQDDRAAIRNYISSAFLLLTVVAAILVAIFFVAYPFVSWYRIFNVLTTSAQAESGPAVAAFLVCFAIGIPASIVQRAQMGLQQGFASSLWQCLASVFSLIAVLWAIWVEASLSTLVWALMGAPLLVNVLNMAVYFWRVEPGIAPQLKDVSIKSMRYVAKTGVLFFVLQLAGALGYSVDNLVVAQVINATAVAGYSVADKLFSFVPMVVSMLVMPLWPAYGEAASRKDDAWIWRTLRLSVLGSAAIGLAASVPLVLGGPLLIRLWVGHSVDVGMPLLIGLAVWKVLQCVGFALAAFLNGMNVIRFQIVTSLAGAVMGIILKVYLVKMLGAQGIPWATAIVYILSGVLPIWWYIDRMKRNEGRRPFT